MIGFAPSSVYSPVFRKGYSTAFNSRRTATLVMAAAPMIRNTSGEFTCPDFEFFRPNLSPAEMFGKGAFGGTYFRDIEIDGKWYRDAWKEFEPLGWFEGLSIPDQVASPVYKPGRNCYGVKCGQGLDVWLEKGWIKPEFDSHGWVHWYCRFFMGRRCDDDERQVRRWIACAGEKGRWKRNLIAKCVKAGKSFDDKSVSPVVRQTLLHWAYELTEEHFESYKKEIRGGKSTSFVPQISMAHVVDQKEEEDERRPKRVCPRRIIRVQNGPESEHDANSVRAIKLFERKRFAC